MILKFKLKYEKKKMFYDKVLSISNVWLKYVKLNYKFLKICYEKWTTLFSNE